METNITPKAITLRRGTRADAAFLAHIDEIAGSMPEGMPGWADLVAPLGTSAAAFLEAVFATGASNWGHAEDFIILEAAGEPVAACAVYEPDRDSVDNRPLRLTEMPDVARHLGWSAAMLDDFLTRYDEFWGPADAPMFAPQAPAIIETVGVIQRMRGQGLGRRLIQEAITEAGRRGHQTVGIMVIIGNDPARSLYERLGFQPVITYHSAYFDDQFSGVIKYRRTTN